MQRMEKERELEEVRLREIKECRLAEGRAKKEHDGIWKKWN